MALIHLGSQRTNHSRHHLQLKSYNTPYRQRGAYVCAVEEMCVCVTEGHNGDGCDLALTLCGYDLWKGYLFVLSWARVRRVMRGSISSGG